MRGRRRRNERRVGGKAEPDREERREKNGTSAVPAKSREVLPSEAPYETDNQREERKRLLRRIKGYIESLFAPKGWTRMSRPRYGGERPSENCPGRVSGF